MRLQLLILIFLFGACHSSERLKGNYFISYAPFGYEDYTFRKDGTFSHLFVHCTGRDTGTGHYFIKNDSLIFIYDSTRLAANEQDFLIRNRKAAETDTVTVKVHAIDGNTGETFPGVIVVAIKGVKTIRGTLTDLDGNALLRIPASEFPVKIQVRVVGFRLSAIDLTDPADYELECILHNSRPVQTVPVGTRTAFHISVSPKKEIRLDYRSYGCDDTICRDTLRLQKADRPKFPKHPVKR